MTRALITGAAGQDGSYLAELLVGEGYEVTGVVRDASATHSNLSGVRDHIELIDTPLDDVAALSDAIRACSPREIYNLAAPTFVPQSWDRPAEVARSIVAGITAILEAVRSTDPAIRVFQASTSELFLGAGEAPQRETTPIVPVTPYGAAKAYAHFLVDAYRRRYGLHASCGILYNHESPRRPERFVPSKVAHAAARREPVSLGDLDARRDWGYAKDYVEAMWRMLQQDEPGDYVIATGEAHSVAELVAHAYGHVGLDWREYVRSDDSLKRGVADTALLVGDAAKAHDRLGWRPSVTFEELVRLLVDAQTGS